MHDAPHGTKQTDEWCGGTDAGQFGQTALVIALDVLQLLAQHALQYILWCSGMFQVLLCGIQVLQFGESGLRQSGDVAFAR
jgi:hypothetical protein